jgi:predicted nuclease with RNAse H fold
LERRGIEVFETYPGAAQDIWKIPRQKDPGGLKRGLARFKVKGNWQRPKVTKDELDALTCALVARDYLRGETMAIGDPEEGLMVLPKTGSRKKPGDQAKGNDGKEKQEKGCRE